MLGMLIPILFVAALLSARGARSAPDAEALHAAASSDDPDAMREAIAGLANLDARDHCGYTPLGLMALYGRFDGVEMLLERGAAVDAPHSRLGTPLMLALRNGHLEIARALLARGANVNVRCEGLDPLACAVLGNNPEGVNLVLAAGADPRATGRRYNLLTIAVQPSEIEVLRQLLAVGVDPNLEDAEGTTPLMNAVECDATESARLLLAAGADASRAGAHGRSPRDVARQRGDRAMLEILEPVKK
jgi:ankyrin repeat protein